MRDKGLAENRVLTIRKHKDFFSVSESTEQAIYALDSGIPGAFIVRLKENKASIHVLDFMFFLTLSTFHDYLLLNLLTMQSFIYIFLVNGLREPNL